MVNYCFDFAVLEMTSENEDFNWEWINLRRDNNLSIEERKKGNFESIEEFLSRIDSRSLNKRGIEAMIQGGAEGPPLR